MNELEQHAAKHLPPKILNQEADLMTTKWWDYRLETVAECQARFLDAYVSAWRLAMTHREERERCQHMLPLKGLKKGMVGLSKTNFTGIWKARQQADAMGCEYRFYCSAAMQYAEQRDWAYLPRPSQLYGAKAMMDDDLSMLEFIAEAVFHGHPRFSRTAYFKARHFDTNCTVKVEHRDSLLRLLKNTSRFLLTNQVCTLTYKYGVLSEQDVLIALGDDLGGRQLEQAKELYRDIIQQDDHERHQETS